MTRAAEALTVIEAMARDAEQANRYAQQYSRQVEHVIDPSPWDGGARISLHVAMLYTPKWEHILALSGRPNQLEKYGVKAHLAYSVVYEGRRALLTREQAIELLMTRELPEGVTLPAPRPAVDLDALFAEVS